MTTTAKPSPGRAQDTDLTERILDVTEEHLRATGFSGLRVEQVASEVGCGKTAIYRRWATREKLAAAVVRRFIDVGVDPDTGSLIEDLVVHQEQSTIHTSFEQDFHGKRPLWGVVVEPGIRSILDQDLIDVRRERGRTIVARAVSRGEVPPETDADALLDMIAGFAFYRTTVRGLRLTTEAFRQAAKTVASAPPLRVIPE